MVIEAPKSGVADARELRQERNRVTVKIDEFNREHEDKPACPKCAFEAMIKGKPGDMKKYQNMKMVRKIPVIVKRTGTEVIWGEMRDWKCPNDHGISFEVWPKEMERRYNPEAEKKK